MRKTFLVLVAMFGCLANSANAEVIVVAVSGSAQYEPGERFASDQKISLAEGARLTVIAKSGDMRVLKGPYTGPPFTQAEGLSEASEDSRWDLISSVLGQPDKRSEVFGASRIIENDVPPVPQVWHVSVDSSGPRCTPASGLTLWRRDTSSTERVSVRNALGRLGDLDWPANKGTLRLPATFPLADGKMLVRVGNELRDLELNLAPPALDDANRGTLLGWLLEKKCNRQAAALIENVHKETELE